MLTVILLGRECPFTCAFCDLWLRTLKGPTEEGSLPRQLARALSAAGGLGRLPRRVKLYNGGNFFDPRAVPPSDLPALAELLRPFQSTVVECHPRLVGKECFSFAEQLDGKLEVAMGLETVNEAALTRLNKEMTLEDYRKAAARLRAAGIGMRSFVLLGTPYVPESEQVLWSTRSVAFAQAEGALVVAIIPVRGGNGELERLEAQGDFRPPDVRDLERALEEALRLGDGVVLADLWDADRLRGCRECRSARVLRLARMNSDGRAPAAVKCASCRGEGG